MLGQSDIVPGRAADAACDVPEHRRQRGRGDRRAARRRAAGRRGREPGVIVLSDHGESLFDEGFLGHGYALNDAQTRIPLIVSGIPLEIVEPFGQADLRDAVRAALSSPSGHGLPSVEQDAARRVFQYLGNIDSPAQIGLTSLSRRVCYDFRSQRARIGDSPWQRPEALEGDAENEFLSLVRLWERMLAARRARAS